MQGGLGLPGRVIVGNGPATFAGFNPSQIIVRCPGFWALTAAYIQAEDGAEPSGFTSRGEAQNGHTAAPPENGRLHRVLPGLPQLACRS